ncbi:hypothetical protein HI113_01915 [Corallococcus exiguus]|uniref:hypothetical protein n=1 Tax=Corallococcus exiguus TaxID=83462 RepID=UPI0014717B70|nr:hypothetical protein [Corallococcus exiguus]NNB84387.1 hypothetical protein [Corallococcus exiguus]NNB92668.1 hypothetical protein [Corallococcus exiguus]
MQVYVDPQLPPGCEDTPPRPSFDAGTPDAGPFVWDGTYTELEEHGDWVDRGPFAPCGFDSRDASSSGCEELSRFDVSNCAPAALARLPQGGHLSGQHPG